MGASALPDVPLGFVCGYPMSVGSGGEMYGGQTYIKSAATSSKKKSELFRETSEVIAGGRVSSASSYSSGSGSSKANPQSLAIQRSIDYWGADLHVCKKKFKPFTVTVETETTTLVAKGRSNSEADSLDTSPSASNEKGTGPDKPLKRKAATGTILKRVQVERMFGCQYHHEFRKAVVKKHGMRKGWQDFGVWSSEKASQRAKKIWWDEQNALKKASKRSPPSSSGSFTSSLRNTITTKNVELYDEEEVNFTKTTSLDRQKSTSFDRMVCSGGFCVWKNSMSDDVEEQVTQFDGKYLTNANKASKNGRGGSKKARKVERSGEGGLGG